MKYIFYLSMLAILCACNSSEKKESAQAIIQTHETKTTNTKMLEKN